MYRMLKKILWLSVLYVSISCIQKEQNIEKTISNSSNSAGASKNYKPLFLGLSPEMSDVEYQNQIKLLNQRGTLHNSVFTIESNENFPDFYVKKEHNSIRLWYKNFTKYNNDELSSEFSKELVEEYTLTKNEILKVYSKKYDKNDWQFPEGTYLPSYNFPQEDYIILKDSDKYIVIGYSLKGFIYKTREQRIAEDIAMGKDVNPVDPIYGTFRYEHEFGLGVDIDYFDKKILEQLVNEMKKENEELLRKFQKEKEVYDAQQKVRSKNIDEI